MIDHYENPRNVGSFNKGDENVGTGLVGAPACGDVMKLQIKINKDGKTIEKAVFKTFGCGSAIASSSYATELIEGMNIDEAINIKNTDIASHLKLPPVKLHCSMLAEDAIKAAIKDYKSKKSPDIKSQQKILLLKTHPNAMSRCRMRQCSSSVVSGNVPEVDQVTSTEPLILPNVVNVKMSVDSQVETSNRSRLSDW